MTIEMTDRELDAWVNLALFGIESCGCAPGGRSGRKFVPGPDGPFVCTLCGNPGGCPDFTGSRDNCDRAEQKIAELGLEVEYGMVLNLEAGKHLPSLGPFILATIDAKTRCLAMYEIRNHIAAARSSTNE